MTSALDELKALKKQRIWFWRPQLYWYGWRTLLPIDTGHDEWARNTLLFGWTITGRVVVATTHCGVDECVEQALWWDYVEDDYELN